MLPQNNRQPGMNCPECGTFILMPVEEILGAKAFSCPNPDCAVQLRLDQQQSRKSLEALETYAVAMRKLGRSI